MIIGGSGTGKSVLLKHIIGLLKPDSGTVEVDGSASRPSATGEITEFRRKFGMAFQEGRAVRLDDGLAERRLSPCSA